MSWFASIYSCSCPWTCSASVLEYQGLFPQLSHQDIEQLVTGTKLKSCLLVVDTASGRITEDYVISGSNGRSRNTRDLSEYVYCHGDVVFYLLPW